MSKITNVSLVAVLAVSSALTLQGCGQPDNQGFGQTNQPTRYCVDQQQHRVPDGQCNTNSHVGGSSPFLWYYLGTLNGGQRSYSVPPIGGYAGGGSTIPSAGVSYGSSSAVSTSSARGGFGATASAHGGGGGAGE